MAPQVPRNMAKARLLEVQSQQGNAPLSGTMSDTGATR